MVSIFEDNYSNKTILGAFGIEAPLDDIGVGVESVLITQTLHAKVVLKI